MELLPLFIIALICAIALWALGVSIKTIVVIAIIIVVFVFASWLVWKL